MATRNNLVENNISENEKFRAGLAESEKELILLREENCRLKGIVKANFLRTRLNTIQSNHARNANKTKIK